MKGQIVKIISNNFTVNSNGNFYECSCRGKFRNDKVIPLVGDYVIFDSSQLLIKEILPRKNELVRPSVSNIDQGIIVTSVKNPDFSFDLLDLKLKTEKTTKLKRKPIIPERDLVNKRTRKKRMNSIHCLLFN